MNVLRNRRRGVAPIFVACALSVCVGGDAWAQGAAPAAGAPAAASAAQEAEKKFAAGLEAVQSQKWAEARDAFAAAHAASPDDPKYLAALIKAEVATGRYREAAEHLRTLLRKDLDPTTRAQAVQMLADAKQKIGTVRIQVTVEGAEVLVDGKPAGPIADDIFVDPGTRTFEAKKDGFTPARVVEDVKAGSELNVKLELSKLGPGPAVPGNDTGPNRKLVLAGIGITGGLAVVAGLGIVTNNVLFSAAKDRQEGIGCGGGEAACKQSFYDLHDTRVTLNFVAIGAAIGAGVVGAATLVYALAAKKTDDGTTPRAAVMVGPGGGGLLVTGKF